MYLHVSVIETTAHLAMNVPWEKTVLASVSRTIATPEEDQRVQLSSLIPSSHASDMKDTFVQFWSCQYPLCMGSVPKMKQAHTAYQDKVSIRALHVNLSGVNTSSDELSSFIRANEIEYEVRLVQDDKTALIWDTFLLPHGILVDCNGKIKWSGSLLIHDVGEVFERFYGGRALEASDHTGSTSQQDKKESPTTHKLDEDKRPLKKQKYGRRNSKVASMLFLSENGQVDDCSEAPSDSPKDKSDLAEPTKSRPRKRPLSQTVVAKCC